MIVDCHCHAGRGDLLTAPWNTDAPLGAYLRRAQNAGITHTIVFPAFHSDYTVANRELARLVAGHGGRLIGFAMVQCGRDAGRIDEMLDEAVRRFGFRGVKVHGHEHLPTRELCEAAQRLRIPVLVDVGGKAHVIDMFAPQYPAVNFIIPHLGSFADSFRAHQEVIDQLVRYPNVYADTSGVRRFDYLVEAVRRAGPHKILFGSDGPWLHPGLELHKIKLLGLAKPAERLITGANARRLILGAGKNGTSSRAIIPHPRSRAARQNRGMARQR
jgi:predicted TIM-barrel fold metal-dependent hydrolase